MILELAEIMISQKLKQVIKERGISVVRLARAVSRPANTVNNHVYGRATPSGEDLLLYCKALDLSVDDFADCVDFTSVSPLQKTTKPKKRATKKPE